MKLERSDIEFPLWRKKVDASLFKDAVTPIPKFLWAIWNIEPMFRNCTKKENLDSEVFIFYKKVKYKGRVIYSSNKKMYRLFFSNELADILKDDFLMSYMRSIEQDLRKGKLEYKSVDIEEEIPFWEFLDIEFDSANKMFKFKAYYVQKPVYLELFKELVNSHTLRRIDDKINQKEDFRITKGDWRRREELKNQICNNNVIYNLIDTQNKQIYIGETESLLKRLSINRSEIEGWDYYRFDVLPDGLTKKQRVAIERLLIRTFSSFFENSKEIPSMKVSEYVLVNKKIDV
ncbi:hypothetical protein [uncultured Pontibacter sp.]|uniref:hypothetical protein n=1 Tax=uncultured Pontibacter sp. TaxID=453356 RepID=UPI00261D2F0C|nr:hypothetical protein [uncultured Pontibacter sp.]